MIGPPENKDKNDIELFWKLLIDFLRDK